MGRNLGYRSFSVAVAAAAIAFAGMARAQTTVTIGIGTQDTTTNTATAGTIVRELHLLEKYLPKDGKYANIKFELDWQNFTSGPPVTNGMMANKLQFGMMGDYPLIVNGFNFENNPESKSRLIAVAAYSLQGSGNGIVVHKDSPYYELSDLKGKLVSVPFGSAAHGMVLKAMQDKGWPSDYFQLVSQSSGSRIDQPAAKEDRRPRRFRAVRRTVAVPWFCPQDLRRRRDQPSDLARRRRPHRLRREISGGGGRLYQGRHRRQRLAARRSQAGGGENSGMDRHQQGSGSISFSDQAAI